MFVDARLELTPPTRLEAGQHASRVIDLHCTGGVGCFDLDASLIVREASGPVGAAFQTSDDGERWENLFASRDLPAGATPVTKRAFNGRFVRVVWHITEGATVASRINNQGDV